MAECNLHHLTGRDRFNPAAALDEVPRSDRTELGTWSGSGDGREETVFDRGGCAWDAIEAPEVRRESTIRVMAVRAPSRSYALGHPSR